MKVAIIHYWLVTMRGGERVLERICRMYPGADIFTHVYVPGAVSEFLRGQNIRTTFIQNLPFAARLYQKYLPLMPMALAELDLESYDLVISMESGPSKGIIPRPDATHVCYCHTPMRYIWDEYHSYRRASGTLTRTAMPFMAERLRNWDVNSSARVDSFAANSRFVAQRIRKYYRRDSDVIYPPVGVDLFAPVAEPDDYYLWVGQMVPYKGCDIAIEAFNRLKLTLLVVGNGPERKRLMRMAGPNICFIDSMPLDQLRRAYAGAQALIFTAKEDFGIVPVEAQASGRPVIAYRAGGAMETVREGETGLFFNARSADSLTDAVELFQHWKHHFDSAHAVANAHRFRPEVFDERFQMFVNRALDDNADTEVPVAPRPLAVSR